MAIDREKVFQNAQKFVEKKRYDKAVLEYQKIIQEDPNDTRTLLKIGDLQAKLESYTEAVATYDRVGRIYASQGTALKAVAVYKQIRELIAKHVPALEASYGHIVPKLAELYEQLGMKGEAISALDAIASRLQKEQRDLEAIDFFRRVVDLDSANPLPHLRLAEAFSRTRNIEGAVQEFAIAALQLVKLNRSEDALKVFERLLHHRQDPIHARLTAELYLARNLPNDGMLALAKLQIAFQANSKDLDTLELLARAFTAIGQTRKAVEVHKEMARIAIDQGRSALFRQLVDTLLRVAPDDEDTRSLAAMSPGDGGGPAVPPPPKRESDSAEVLLGELEALDPVDESEMVDDLVEDIEEAVISDGSIELIQPPPSRPSSSRRGTVEAALEESEFFVSRGLLDDARAVLREQLARFPNHPIVLERVEELEAHAATIASGSGTRSVLPPDSAAGREFDIASSLEALEQLEHTMPGTLPTGDLSATIVDIEEVFQQFKQGTAATQVPVEDPQSHYDLGTAYKEMGLFDEAVREFGTAAMDPTYECISQSMIGLLEVQRGNLSQAIEAFQKGLRAKQQTSDQELALRFELGNAYETQQMTTEALHAYQAVARQNPNYRDIQERVRRLSKLQSKLATP